MKRYLATFTTTSLVAWMAFAQSPTPTPTPGPSSSPGTTPGATPTPDPTNSKLCCVRVYKREDCRQVSDEDPTVILRETIPYRAILPNDLPDIATVSYVDASTVCPEKTWSVKWELTGSTCNVNNWMHLKTWTRLVHVGTHFEAQCQRYKDLPPYSLDEETQHQIDALNEMLRSLIDAGV